MVTTFFKLDSSFFVYLIQTFNYKFVTFDMFHYEISLTSWSYNWHCCEKSHPMLPLNKNKESYYLEVLSYVHANDFFVKCVFNGLMFFRNFNKCNHYVGFTSCVINHHHMQYYNSLWLNINSYEFQVRIKIKCIPYFRIIF